MNRVEAAGDEVMSRALKRFLANRNAQVGAIVLVLLIAICLFAPLFSMYAPNAMELDNLLKPPSKAHPFGTDNLGRDYLTRTIYGGRISLTVGFVCMAMSVLIGTTIGAVAGYFGGTIDNALMRLVDFINSLPIFFIVMIAQMVLTPSIFNVILVIGLTSWMSIARIVRGEVMSIREQEFITSARAMGAPAPRILWKHILPNVSGPILVTATLGIAQAILTESSLSFLGLGVQAPDASWGNMLNGAQNRMLNAPWIALFPGIMISATVMSFNFFGDGLRDALDPKTGLRHTA